MLLLPKAKGISNCIFHDKIRFKLNTIYLKQCKNIYQIIDDIKRKIANLKNSKNNENKKVNIFFISINRSTKMIKNKSLIFLVKILLKKEFLFLKKYFSL